MSTQFLKVGPYDAYSASLVPRTGLSLVSIDTNLVPSPAMDWEPSISGTEERVEA